LRYGKLSTKEIAGAGEIGRSIIGGSYWYWGLMGINWADVEVQLSR
jgi:hypothetical protein